MKPLAEVLRYWEAVIGLEIHTELTALETKMFCGCKLSHDDPPNTHVCPVCLGLPGALPVPNEAAIEAIVMAGLATGCAVQRRSMFYRKHYFYPDMAKNFQTTQGPVAFVMHGRLDLEVAGEGAAERPDETIAKEADGSYVAPIRIKRIHMEEDAAKMVHVGGLEGRIDGASESLIDYNRCGTPLIELVTEPDLRTPEEARLFMEKLRQIWLALGISDCSMEKGSMRCDGNVSLRRCGEEGLGVKTELKNLNSFKALHDGLAYEICRQAEVLEASGELRQETRHWEPSQRRTVVMRVKETNDDYRMYPDPDLAPFDLSDAFVERCRARLPELPDEKRDRYERTWGIRRREAAMLSASPQVAAQFEEVVDLLEEVEDGPAGARDGGLQGAGDGLPEGVLSRAEMRGGGCQGAGDSLPEGVLSRAEMRGGGCQGAGDSLPEGGLQSACLRRDAAPAGAMVRLARTAAKVMVNFAPSFTALSARQIAAVVRLLADNALTFAQAREVLAAVDGTDDNPERVVDERGWRQSTDADVLAVIVDEVLARCGEQVRQYRDGNTKVLGYLVGQCMRASAGAGNPRLFNKLLRSRLGE